MKKHVVATVGTMALLANLLLPGLAFGQGSDPQAGEVTLGCGTLTLFVVSPNDFQMWDALGLGLEVANVSQDAFATKTGTGYTTTYQSGTSVLPTEAFVRVTDTRTTGTGCATNGTDEGWELHASATDFTSGSNTIAADGNFTTVTTTNVTFATPTYAEQGTDGTTTNLIYREGFSGGYTITAPYNVGDASSLTVKSTFAAGGNLGAGAGAITLMDNATGAGTDDFKFGQVGTGVAYYLNIPAYQQGGTYASTVTLDLVAAT